jgi:NAD+ synthase
MEINSLTLKEKADKIVEWIRNYANNANMKSLIVGVSGGVDSGLVSTLCAMTGIPTYVVSMPIRQAVDQLSRARAHMEDLKSKYDNVIKVEIDLSNAFFAFEKEMVEHPLVFDMPLGMANSRSRYRMMTLYQIASSFRGLVVGTGNKVEDFGVGFYTKYGDGGVDISPIADLYKTEVREMAREIGVIPEIADAIPTDGLWEDGRNDEDQIGASYEELEWAMKYSEISDNKELTNREMEVLKIYSSFHEKNLHKMNPIPVFKV